MTYEDEVECGYWEKIFRSLCTHNRENSTNKILQSEYLNQVEIIFEGYEKTIIENEHSIQVNCRLRGDYSLFFDIGFEQRSYSYNFVRFSKRIQDGNIQLCNPVFSKVPFWEINEFLQKFEIYKDGLQNELAKIPRKEKITNLIMEMIRAYLINYFENSKTTWNVCYEEGLYIVTINNGKDNSKFKLTPSNWCSEIIQKLKNYI
ncbi:MAG: hypothetical protein MJ174_10565 [Treponema sp.]|nr:hypothetical protein [Treponema sp.]